MVATSIESIKVFKFNVGLYLPLFKENTNTTKSNGVIFYTILS